MRGNYVSITEVPQLHLRILAKPFLTLLGAWLLSSGELLTVLLTQISNAY
jgi:hypothetical protein